MNELYRRQRAVTDLYVKYTGIQTASEQIMQETFEIKEAICKDCVPKLQDCEGQLFRSENRKKNWRKASFVGVPVAFGIGFLFGLAAF